MQQKTEIINLTTKEDIQKNQLILANYDFSQLGSRKIILKGVLQLCKEMIILSEDILKRDKNLKYGRVDFDGNKSIFTIEIQYKLKK